VNHVVMSMGTDEEFCRQIDDKIVETLWQTESKGLRKQGRRLVARKRLSMSYEMGGLEIPLVEDIAHELRCNFFGRMYNMIEIGDSKSPFVVSLFEKFLNQRQVDRIKELVEVGGSQIYGLLADRSRRHSTFFSQVFRSMSNSNIHSPASHTPSPGTISWPLLRGMGRKAAGSERLPLCTNTSTVGVVSLDRVVSIDRLCSKSFSM